MNMDNILHYLTELELHNDREWYHANKGQYQQANQEFEELIEDLISEISRTDGEISGFSPRELTFKLVRDTRFSHDKSPYNPVFRAHISSKGKLPIPVGYFIMIKPGDRSFLGGGLFADMFSNATDMVRSYIADHGEEWTRIITDPEFTKFFTVGGTALKNVPRGYDKEHPQAEYLKYKSWYLEYFMTDQQLREPDFIDHAVRVFTAMQPFNGFLNRALAGFEMPARPK